MDYPTFFLLISCLLPFIYSLIISGRRNSRLPPGPYAFPIIGNLFEFGVRPHQSLATLSKLYGPIMSLKLGRKTVIVVSSPEIAKEFLQTHDASFSSRSVPHAIRAGDFDKYSILWLPVGDKWRKLRKVEELLNHVNQCCRDEKALNVGEAAFTTSLNLLSNFMFSMDLAQYGLESTQEFRDAVCTMLDAGAQPTLPDLFPIIDSLDPLGLLRQENVTAKKVLTIFEKIINRRLQTRLTSSSCDGLSTTNNDALDLLLNLSLKDESNFSQFEMRNLFLSLYIAGTDTTSSTLEWAMAELIRNPEKMEKTRSELDKLMQNKDRAIQEDDIPQLPYLQAVIKETLRLHPPVPFLIPREAIHDVEVHGFIVPKNAQILCNVWAMGRDQTIWPDAEVFMPERFLDKKTDYKGQHFELIPFGAGRRICPGLNLSHRTLHITLGSLIHKFDWKVVGCTKPQDIDMEEKFAITLKKEVPLMAIPVTLL